MLSKRRAIEVEWDADEEKDEETCFSVVEIKITIFNWYSEHGSRIYFNAAWNSKHLQVACDCSENNNNAELSNEIE